MKADKVDVIVATGFPAVLALCKVENVPTVVANGGGDPVATHLIDGLSRPGGNITGISDNATTLSTKRRASQAGGTGDAAGRDAVEPGRPRDEHARP